MSWDNNRYTTEITVSGEHRQAFSSLQSYLTGSSLIGDSVELPKWFNYGFAHENGRGGFFI